MTGLSSAVERGRESGQAPMAAPPPKASARRYLRPERLLTYSVLWALLIEIAIFSALSPDVFATWANARSILGSQAVLLIIALGLTVALAANEFDLSIAAVAGFSQVIVGWLTVEHGWGLGAAIVAALLVGLTIGVINAFLVVRLGIGSFIGTLASGTLLTGLSLKITNSEPITNIPQGLVDASSHELLGLQLVFWYALAGTIVLWYVLSHTPVGRWIYFTGANPQSAQLNGLPVGRIRAASLVVCAVVAAIGGILYAGLFGAADPNTATDQFLLPSYAAAFLGATAVVQGRFNAWGTFISVYLVVTGIVGLSLVTNQVGWISFAFNGGVLIIALAAQRFVVTRQQRAAPPA